MQTTDHSPPPELETNICVGGPRAGQQIEVRTRGGFIVPMLEFDPLPIRPPKRGEQPRFGAVRYVRETYRHEYGEISFWRPEGQSLGETLELLLSTYMAAQRPAR